MESELAPLPRRESCRVTDMRPSRRLRPDLTLDELAALWEQARRPRAKGAYVVHLAVAMFKAVVGDIPAGQITHEDLLIFRDGLSLFPTSITAEECGLPRHLLYALWLENGAGERRRLAGSTIANRQYAIRRLLRFAYAERWIASDETAFIRIHRTAKFSRRSFTRDELRRLFLLPLFVRPWTLRERRTQVISHETCRWLFFLSLMTGARLEEVGQLHTEDVALHDGVWVVRINDLDSAGVPTDRVLKSPASRRLVPLHRRLLDLGFLRYVGHRRNAGEPTLFSDLKRNRWNRCSHSVGTRCARIIDCVSPDPALVFHSFRHTFKDMCREAGLEDSINDQLTGHAPPTIGRTYGDGVDVAALARAIARLDYEFIEWEPILRSVPS